ncbi:hypothetical protein [Nocardiopsis xinjiangensis]|uniref:hypothetical protein n=1 Tax=Nocardiopsis xinjiangensis TaxID=124285 RepID=UPI00034BC2B8|nr:hypothetical protein [Nocardiopsis xinjiangensis]
MTDNPSDLSALTGPELVRAFLAEYDKPRSTSQQRAEFFEFKSRVFAAIAEREGDAGASRFAARAKADSEFLWAEIADNGFRNGGEY